MRSVDREREWAKRLARVGEWVEALEEGRGAEGLEGAHMQELRIKLNTREEGDTLIIAKATDGVKDYVAFVGALTATEALLTWRKRSMTTGLRWREDQPWQEA